MIERVVWLKRVQQAWARRSVVWLSGVRRVGKTTIARMLPDAVYLNCDLPSSVRALEDPELFLGSQANDAVVVFDEVHRLADPSRLLKIAADEYPKLKVLATGSSTLAATRKFSDSLTGRKRAIHLCPVLWARAKITSHFRIPSSRHLGPVLSCEILTYIEYAAVSRLPGRPNLTQIRARIL